MSIKGKYWHKFHGHYILVQANIALQTLLKFVKVYGKCSIWIGSKCMTAVLDCSWTEWKFVFLRWDIPTRFIRKKGLLVLICCGCFLSCSILTKDPHVITPFSPTLLPVLSSSNSSEHLLSLNPFHSPPLREKQCRLRRQTCQPESQSQATFWIFFWLLLQFA